MPPRLTFMGAAGTVTGSKYLLESAGRRLLVDCGLFQGRKELRQRNWADPPFDLGSLDAIALTHAHVDHCAYLPRLARLGYDRPVYATPSTIDLVALVLPDSAHLQEEEAEYANEKGHTRHAPALPLYGRADAEAALRLLRPLPYHELREIVPGIAIRPTDAGHILGSAALTVQTEGQRIVFSGDIGRYDEPILNDPEPIERAEWVLCESTYGDRLHGSAEPLDLLVDAITTIVDRRGVMVVPAFAIGRTQALLYALRELEAAGRIPRIPVAIDSPMAIAATRIFGDHPDIQDAAARALLANGTPPLAYPDLRVAAARDQSMALNHAPGPLIIISSSGMATGGRVLHHLRNRLPDPGNMVLLVGFQAEGTRGRSLQDGVPEVKIHGRMVPVRAEVRTISGFSAHADQAELMRWLGGFVDAPRRLFLVHGEEGPRRVLGDLVAARRGWQVALPEHLEVVDLA